MDASWPVATTAGNQATEGKLYLCPVKDACSKRMVGSSIGMSTARPSQFTGSQVPLCEFLLKLEERPGPGWADAPDGHRALRGDLAVRVQLLSEQGDEKRPPTGWEFGHRSPESARRVAVGHSP